jgi:hypothetical protein
MGTIEKISRLLDWRERVSHELEMGSWDNE